MNYISSKKLAKVAKYYSSITALKSCKVQKSCKNVRKAHIKEFLKNYLFNKWFFY